MLTTQMQVVLSKVSVLPVIRHYSNTIVLIGFHNMVLELITDSVVLYNCTSWFFPLLELLNIVYITLECCSEFSNSLIRW